MKNSKLQMLSKMNSLSISESSKTEENKEAAEETTITPKEEEEVTPKPELFDIRKELTEKELTTLDEFIKEMQEHLTNEKRKKFCTDLTFVRYLR